MTLPWDQQMCPDYQGVLIIQVSLYDKAPFGTIPKCVDMQVFLVSSVLINRCHCITHQSSYILVAQVLTIAI